MKLLVVSFLSFSSAFYNSDVILHKKTQSTINKYSTTINKYSTNRNYYNNKYLNNNFNRKLHYYNKNGNSEEDKENNDIMEILGGFMGYPTEQKWKGTRFLVYSLIAGYLLGDAIEKLNLFIINK